MQGPLPARRGAALSLYVMVWLMLGLLLAGLVDAATGADMVNSLLFALPVTAVYGFASSFSTYYQCRAYPLAARGALTIMAVFVASAAMAACVWLAIGMAWNGMLLALGVSWAGVEAKGALPTLMFGLGLILYGLSAVAHYLAIEAARARDAERRGLESQLAAREAELRMLRTQIDPHFLFNSLNSISALTSQDPAGARRMTLRLADFFRRSLGLEAHTKVTLAQELALLTDFLAIEEVRFGARLTVAWQIDPATLDCLLPPMILQPLVENAVKHGIGNLLEGGRVTIGSAHGGAVLRLSVENDIDGSMPLMPTMRAGAAGIGLVNVRERLAAAYGHEASIICTREGATFRVVLTLPLDTKEAPCA
ncbi:MAG: histidine kinase [Massilia sp.]